MNFRSAFACCFAFAASYLPAEEGMWPFNRIPVDAIETQYGVRLSPEWIDHVQKSCLRISLGGSGSFVSPQGLVLTNHHVGSSAIYHLSTQENDLVANGFLAKTFDEELPCANMYVDQLISIQDVTDAINAKIGDISGSAEREKARTSAMNELKEAARKESGLQPEIVSLYQGARNHLYLYKRYTDVRLVMAPEQSIAFFGGDTDNFEYPRYDLDICFFRVYEDGKPLKTEHFLTWSPAGPQLEEPLFVVGHPGKTRRMLTSAHLAFLQKMDLTLFLEWFRTRQAKLQEFGRISPEHARIAEKDLFSIENSLKVFNSLYDSLASTSLIADKKNEENALFASADPAPWTNLQTALDEAHSYYREFLVLEGMGSNYSRLYALAKRFIRLAEESKKPNEDRLKEYTDAEIATFKLDFLSTEPVYEELEKLRLRDSFQRTIQILGPDHPVSVLLSNADIDTLLRETKLFDLKYREDLYQSLNLPKQPQNLLSKLRESCRISTMASALKNQILRLFGYTAPANQDPFILLAKAVDPYARKVRLQKEERLDAVQTESYDAIAKSLFAKYGETIYPDATFTLRLSLGSMKGYFEGDQYIEPTTEIGGAFLKAVEHDFQKPFDLPESWTRQESALRLQTPFNFVSTNDIIGGNSGSPVINQRGELVGLIFDGNIHSILWSFKFDEIQARATSVHSAGILEALRHVYHAERLIQEIAHIRS